MVADVVSHMPYTALVLGTQEFTDGIHNLLSFMHRIGPKFLCTNYDFSQLNETLQAEFTKLCPRHRVVSMREAVGRHRRMSVALLGYTTPEAQVLLQPNETIIFEDEVEALNREIALILGDASYQKRRDMFGHGVKVFVAVGHAGLDRDLEIADQVSSLDVIVGGHSHTLAWPGVWQTYVPMTPEDPADIAHSIYPAVVTQRSGRKVAIVHAGKHGKYMGSIDIGINADGEVRDWWPHIFLLKSSYRSDEEVDKIMEEYDRLLDHNRTEVLGHIRVPLAGSPEACFARECALGNLVAEAVLWVLRRHAESLRDSVRVALINAAAFSNGDIPAGDITLGGILKAMPYQDTLTVVRMKGSTLQLTLDHSVGLAHTGGFLHLAGARLVADWMAPAGHRAVSVTVRRGGVFEPLNVTADYDVVVPAHVADGGDGYRMVLEGAEPSDAVNVLDVDVMIRFFRAFHWVEPQLDGRIIIMNPDGRSRGARTTVGVASVVMVVMLWVWYCVRLSNKIIERCELPVEPVREIRDIRSEFFVRLLEVLNHRLPPGIIEHPETPADEVHNVQTIINHLALDLIDVDLSHISGAQVIAGNAHAIYNLLEIFCGLHKYLSSHEIDRWHLEESLTETEEELSTTSSSTPTDSQSADQEDAAAAPAAETTSEETAAAAAKDSDLPPSSPSRRSSAGVRASASAGSRPSSSARSPPGSAPGSGGGSPSRRLSAGGPGSPAGQTAGLTPTGSGTGPAGAALSPSTKTSTSGGSAVVSFPESQYSLEMELPITKSGSRQPGGRREPRQDGGSPAAESATSPSESSPAASSSLESPEDDGEPAAGGGLGDGPETLPETPGDTAVEGDGRRADSLETARSSESAVQDSPTTETGTEEQETGTEEQETGTEEQETGTEEQETGTEEQETEETEGETEETPHEPHRFEFIDEQTPETGTDTGAGGDEFTNMAFDADSDLESDEVASVDGTEPDEVDISRQLSEELQQLQQQPATSSGPEQWAGSTAWTELDLQAPRPVGPQLLVRGLQEP
ncbi:5'-nucleotidase [Amphibalanus amphitrite]|uniref:5'-nucleotidase n=1 Tax=Amphibalanus amphitrite TaxID=1232801 RepID=A0A6A4XE70_AMPAM|nr:5'-nucleotidase [Amphibalanus amphitrite]